MTQLEPLPLGSLYYKTNRTSMNLPEITHCPGTLANGNNTYSRTCLSRMFNGKKVHHILPYHPPDTNNGTDQLFTENQNRISISGVQEKFSIMLAKNKLRLITEGQQGGYILKTIPIYGKNLNEMPANEHLTMQIARQVFNIETAENALIFFANGKPAYITKRFDVNSEAGKLASEDFASLAGKTPQTHGENYKYSGNYLQLFNLLEKHIPAHKVEAPKLFKLLVFNYLFSNGDAHLKNFSILETPQGDFRLSPAYDLLNTRIHVADTDFALSESLLPKHLANGKILQQFIKLAKLAGISSKQTEAIIKTMLSSSNKIEKLIAASFLSERTKRNYSQAYNTRLNKLSRA